MHLILLGVMRKLIFLWLGGKVPLRLQSRDVTATSQLLIRYRKLCPTEFALRPRSLHELRNWKATELRSFLLYFGVVVLRKHLPDRLYKNFLLLSCAMRILVHKRKCVVHNDFADRLMRTFATDCVALFGPFVKFCVKDAVDQPIQTGESSLLRDSMVQ